MTDAATSPSGAPVCVFVNRNLAGVSALLEDEHGIPVVVAENADDLRSHLAVADVLLTSNSMVAGEAAEIIRRADKLRWIQSTSIGCDQIEAAGLDPAVVLTNAAGLNAAAVSAHAIGLMLAVARGLTGSAGRQAESRWDATASVAEMVPLDGGKLLCVGYGAIGRRVAAIGRSLGMQVIAFNRTGAGPGEAHRVARLSELDGEIGTATALILCLPATPETRGLLNAARIAALPERAIVVNVGRGELVEEAALIDALSHGRIAGAAIDVAIDEPLGPDSPLWAAPRLLITPHVAGQGEKTLPALASLVAANLRALRAGKKLQNVLTR